MNALSLRALAPMDADALATITGPQTPGGSLGQNRNPSPTRSLPSPN
jgi:hypothetical protein